MITKHAPSSDLEYGHFSDVLPTDINFQETAKTSIQIGQLNHNNNFYRAVCFLTHADEADFDQICQELLAEMLRNLNNEIRGKAKLVHIWQGRHVLTFLWSQEFDHLVNSVTLGLFCNRPRMVVIMLTLAQWA